MKRVLTDEELRGLRASICPLEENIRKSTTWRPTRDLIGEEGVLARTLGGNFQGPREYTEHYFDSRRGENTLTEFAEFMEALGTYDHDKSVENRVKLYLEVGDIIKQQYVIDIFHKEDAEYEEVKRQVSDAMEYIHAELKKRDLSMEKARMLAEIKYGVILWLTNKGELRDKELEERVCLEYIVG